MSIWGINIDQVNLHIFQNNCWLQLKKNVRIIIKHLLWKIASQQCDPLQVCIWVSTYIYMHGFLRKDVLTAIRLWQKALLIEPLLILSVELSSLNIISLWAFFFNSPLRDLQSHDACIKGQMNPQHFWWRSLRLHLIHNCQLTTWSKQNNAFYPSATV